MCNILLLFTITYSCVVLDNFCVEFSFSLKIITKKKILNLNLTYVYIFRSVRKQSDSCIGPAIISAVAESGQ